MIPSCLEGHEAPGTPLQAFVGIQPLCENTSGLRLHQCMQRALASVLGAALTPQDHARHHLCMEGKVKALLLQSVAGWGLEDPQLLWDV